MDTIRHLERPTPTLSIKPSPIARLFKQGRNFRSVEVDQFAITIHGAAHTLRLPFKKIRDITVTKGIFWSRIRIDVDGSVPFMLTGLTNASAERCHRDASATLAAFHVLARYLLDNHSSAVTVGSWLDMSMRGEHWVANHAVLAALQTVKPFASWQAPALELTDDLAIAESLGKVLKFIRNPEEFRRVANARFTSSELLRFRDYFEHVEKNPLSEAQRRAVITHEDNTRVIAGAGSGKTSVMAVKAGYLLKKELCREDQLLLVAFNKSAAKELSVRAEAIVGAPVRATTFHALGLDIIGQVTGKRPSLAKTAEDSDLLKAQIREMLVELVKKPETSDVVRTYFQSFFAPYKDEREFETLGDYYAYLNTVELRTIKDERLKSFEEVEIANFLFLNSVAYEYERPYQIDVADAQHSQYRPDFYLPAYGIYIEHFGVGRDGSTAHLIDAITYREQMEWKRALHKEHGTLLVETYSYMRKEGNLTKELQRKLTALGVSFTPISAEELLAELQNSKQIDPFSELTATFLNHFKGNGFRIRDVQAMARHRRCDTPRLEAFLNLFEPIYTRYEDDLRENRQIDFNDMITQAAGFAAEGTYRSPYSCILVDEFQDISTGRAKLIKGLADQSPSHRLFCVGDDWQAIYRFAGSDIALMRDFAEHFGYSESVYLDRTYRFNDRIEAVASRFVQQNPAQIPKTIICRDKAHGPRVVIHRPLEKGQDVFLDALEEISLDAGLDRYTILILGRYRKLRDGLAWSAAARRFPGIKDRFQTVHSAKGREADYVVVLGMTSGRYGFPSEIADDPLLDAVLSEPESFPHAEERRLFYVALTRAKRAVHLIADYAKPSAFLTEIATYQDSVKARGGAAETPTYCPECVTGELIRRTGKFGVFFSCANYPLCDFKAPTCKRCDQGAFVRHPSAGIYVCSNLECGHSERICPKCGTGRLTERTSQYGSFLGCTNFSKGNCRHKEKIH